MCPLPRTLDEFGFALVIAPTQRRAEHFGRLHLVAQMPGPNEAHNDASESGRG